MTGEKEKEEWIIWLLQFIQTNLHKTSAGDRAKLGVEISQLANTVIGSAQPVMHDGAWGIKYSQQILIRDGEGRMHDIFSLDLLAAQECLKGFLTPILTGIEELQSKMDGQWVKDELILEPTFHSFEVRKMRADLRATGLHYAGTGKLKGDGEVEYNYKYPPLQDADVRITLRFVADSMEESLMFNVTRILEDVPISVFRRCPECNRWFPHFSERKKQFCSNRCAARYGVRESRKELKSNNPEKYEEELRAGAERARKSYVADVNRRLPNAKPDRRPTKHREE